MSSKRELLENLIKRLISLGYPSTSVMPEFRTNYGQYIDIVVNELGKPKIAVEVKAGFDIPSSAKEIDMLFDPTIRQAQLYANAISAPFFAVFNGTDIYWFDVDEKNGRARMLDHPVYASSDETSYLTDEDDNIAALRLLFALYDLVRGTYDIHKALIFVSISLLAKLYSEYSDHRLEKRLLKVAELEEEIDSALEKFISRFNEDAAQYFSHGSAILGSDLLLRFSAKSILNALDELVLANRKLLGTFKLPNWLLELITALAQVKSHTVVLDLYSNFGDGVAMIAKSSDNTQIISVAVDDVSYLWDLLKRLLLNLNPNDLYQAHQLSNYKTLLANMAQDVDTVVVTPPFGAQVIIDGQRRTSEELFLQMAISQVKPNGRIVAIVPDNFLFSTRHQTIRDDILSQSWVRTVVSLEQFMPGTSVKASLLVLDKKSPLNENNGDYKVAMMWLSTNETNSLIQQNLTIKEYTAIQKLLELLSHPLNSDNFIESEQLWLVRAEKLQSNSWAVSSHVSQDILRLQSSIPIVPLGSIATLRKGSPLTLEPTGSIPVIGPSAIRTLTLDAANLDRTTEDRLRPQPVIASVGDVLIHAVGPNRGQAAAVSLEFDGLHISRNVIVAHPNSMQLLPQYLAIALSSAFVKKQMEQRTSGSVIRQLTIRELYEILVPVPDIETQRAIVAKVELAWENLIRIEQQFFTVESELKTEQERLKTLLDTFYTEEGIDA